MKQVLIIGAGFAGLNAAKRLRNAPGVAVTLLDRENHHLFQPLLYQVAMAALSPADIAVPIRSLFARVRNIRVLKAEVTADRCRQAAKSSPMRRVPVRLPDARVRRAARVLRPRRVGAAMRRD